MIALHVNEEGRAMLRFCRTLKDFEDGSSIAGDEVKEKVFIVDREEDKRKHEDAVAFIEATMALDREKWGTHPLVGLIEELVAKGIENYISLTQQSQK